MLNYFNTNVVINYKNTNAVLMRFYNDKEFTIKTFYKKLHKFKKMLNMYKINRYKLKIQSDGIAIPIPYYDNFLYNNNELDNNDNCFNRFCYYLSNFIESIKLNTTSNGFDYVTDLGDIASYSIIMEEDNNNNNKTIKLD